MKIFSITLKSTIAYVTITDVGHPLVLLLTNTFKLFDFQIFRF
jgi:hypothetical protein